MPEQLQSEERWSQNRNTILSGLKRFTKISMQECGSQRGWEQEEQRREPKGRRVVLWAPWFPGEVEASQGSQRACFQEGLSAEILIFFQLTSQMSENILRNPCTLQTKHPICLG